MTHAYLNFQAERERQLDYHYMEDQRREWELKVSILPLRNHYVIDKVECVFPGVIRPEFCMEQRRYDDHQDDTPHFRLCQDGAKLKFLG